jgi:hypothetical protein
MEAQIQNKSSGAPRHLILRKEGFDSCKAFKNVFCYS